MDLSTLKGAPGARKKRKRVGRGPGSGNGKTSGRGHKGQKARSGYSAPAGFEGGQLPLHRRLPKRGFRHQKRYPMAVINVDRLQELFSDGEEVTTAVLAKKKLVHEMRGGVKLLGRGEISKRLVVKVQAASPSARQKIEAAGGVLEIVPAAVDPLAGEASGAGKADGQAAETTQE